MQGKEDRDPGTSAIDIHLEHVHDNIGGHPGMVRRTADGSVGNWLIVAVIVVLFSLALLLCLRGQWLLGAAMVSFCAFAIVIISIIFKEDDSGNRDKG